MSAGPESLPESIRSHPRLTLQPSEARRLLCFELGQLVHEAGVRHQTMATWFGVSRASVTQALAGKNVLSRPALEVLCRNIDRQEWVPRLEVLRQMVRRARLGKPVVAVGPPRDAELVMGLEAFAERVTVFDPHFVPLHLQTHAYAAAFTRPDGATEKTAHERRQASLLEGHDPLPFIWLTSEHALHRRIDSPAVMREQIAHLVELAQRPTIAVRVIPATVGDLDTVGMGFQLIEGTPDVVVEQTHLAVHYAAEPEAVAYFARLVAHLEQRALSREASLGLLSELRS